MGEVGGWVRVGWGGGWVEWDGMGWGGVQWSEWGWRLGSSWMRWGLGEVGGDGVEWGVPELCCCQK